MKDVTILSVIVEGRAEGSGRGKSALTKNYLFAKFEQDGPITTFRPTTKGSELAGVD